MREQNNNNNNQTGPFVLNRTLTSTNTTEAALEY